MKFNIIAHFIISANIFMYSIFFIFNIPKNENISLSNLFKSEIIINLKTQIYKMAIFDIFLSNIFYFLKMKSFIIQNLILENPT